MKISELLNAETAHSENPHEQREDDSPAPNVGVSHEARTEVKEHFQTIKSMSLEEAVKALKKVIASKVPYARHKDVSKLRDAILTQMAMWIQVSLLRSQIEARSPGTLVWKDVGIDSREVSMFRRLRSAAWNAAGIRIQGLEREENTNADDNGWVLREELHKHLSRDAYAFMLSEDEIEAGIDMVIDECEAMRKVTANEIVSMTDLDRLSYKNVVKMLKAELAHGARAFGTRAINYYSFENEETYLGVTLTQFVWVSVLTNARAKKLAETSAGGGGFVFEKADVDVFLNNKVSGYLKCIKRMEDKHGKKDMVKDSLAKAKAIVKKQLMDEGSLQISDTDFRKIIEDMEARCDKQRATGALNRGKKRQASQMNE